MCIGKAHMDRCIPKIITAWAKRSELQFWQSQLEKFLCWKSMNPTWSLLQAMKVWYFRRCDLFRSNLKGFFFSFFVLFCLFVFERRNKLSNVYEILDNLLTLLSHGCPCGSWVSIYHHRKHNQECFPLNQDVRIWSFIGSLQMVLVSFLE